MIGRQDLLSCRLVRPTFGIIRVRGGKVLSLIGPGIELAKELEKAVSDKWKFGGLLSEKISEFSGHL